MTARKEAPSTDICEIGKASKTIGVSPSTLRNWEAKGKITATRGTSGRRFYRVSDVLRLAAENGNKNAAVDLASSDEEREAALALVETTYSSAAASVILNVSLETLRRWRDQGRIAAHESRLLGQIRYPKDVVDEMAEALRAELSATSDV